MENIKSIHLNHLRNDEHFQFITFVLKFTNESGEPQYRALVEAHGLEDEALKKIVKSALTTKIHEADHIRDEVFRSLADTVKAATHHFDYRMRDAAVNLKIVFDTYGNVNEAEKQRLIEQNELSKQQLQQAAPKVQYYNDVLMSEDTYTTTQIAKELGIGALTLNDKLRRLGIQYKQKGQWLLSYKYQNKGYTKTNTHTFTHSNGQQGTAMQTVWTEKGRMFVHSLINP